MRALLILVTLILQALFGWFVYKDHNRCCQEEKREELPVNTKEASLSFKWSDAAAVPGVGWAAMKDSLTKLVGNDQSLEITGWYCQEEKDGTANDTFGLARARSIRALFSEIQDENISLVTRKVSCDSLDRKNPFEAASFAIRTVTKNVIETATETIIYFPSNSSNKLNATDVETYLDQVAARVVQSKEIVSLTGHTDNVGAEDKNVILGQKRADVIKEYLLAKGIPANQVTSNSEGETNPIADNETAEGRAKNRRTILRILPSSN